MGYLEKGQIDALGSKNLLRIIIHMSNKKRKFSIKNKM